MAKKVLVILAEGFEDIEGVAPMDILRRGQVEVTAAGLSALKVNGSRGVVVLADTTLDEVNGEFDALLLPGGNLGAKNLVSSNRVTSIIKSMNEKKKIIAAICAAPAVVLLPTGILKGRRVTSFPGFKENFSGIADYKDDAVVIDDNIITSQGVGTTFQFALAILEKLEGREAVERVAKDAVISR